MAGTIFAGGRGTSFHLTSLARHSVRRPPRRLPRPLGGLDSLRVLQVGLSRPVSPHWDETSRCADTPSASLAFSDLHAESAAPSTSPACDRPFGVYELEDGKPHWRKERFAALVRRNGMSWPTYADGTLDERDQTFREME